MKKGDLVRMRKGVKVHPPEEAGYLFVVAEVRPHTAYPIYARSLSEGGIFPFKLDELEKANDEA